MWLTYQMGFKLSANPFMLATVLIFISLLSCIRHSRVQLIIGGLIYISAVWLVNFLVLTGSYDRLVFQPFIMTAVMNIYSVLAALFAYIGWLHFSDWVRFKRCHDTTMFKVPTPRLLERSPKTERLRHFVYIAILFFICAWFISIAESVLTQNYYLFVSLQHIVKQDAALHRAIAAYFTYMSSYSLVLLCFWAFYLADAHSMRVKSLLNQFIAMEKLVYAALYWAVSVCLVYYLLNVVKF